MRSIQSRLATSLLLSLIILMLAQWIIVASSIRRLSEQYIVSRLIHTSDMLAAAVNLSNQQPALDTTRIDPLYSQPFSGHYYKITVGDTSFRSRSLWDETLPALHSTIGTHVISYITGPQNQSLLLLGMAYDKQGKTIQVIVGEDISGLEQDIDILLYRHATVSLLILALLIALQVFLVRRNLRPLERIRTNLQNLESGIIDALDENVPTELLPLVREINIRIKAVQQRLQRSRNASGNLAHALKGPLTVLRQLANDINLQQHSELRDSLLQHTSAIQQIIDRELKRARLAGSAVGGKQTQLLPEIQTLLQLLNAMYRDKNIAIHHEIPAECVTTMDREDLHEMLGNILDNACKWAQGKINLIIQCQQGLTITVEDDGPGIPEDQRNTILSRGQRLDEQTEGHGLGMSIVTDIINQYGGSMELSQSQTLGGLLVTIRIPPGHSGLE
jgi:signal transduction histidine kinase